MHRYSMRVPARVRSLFGNPRRTTRITIALLAIGIPAAISAIYFWPAITGTVAGGVACGCVIYAVNRGIDTAMERRQ